jgi:hypothetical protein
MRILAALAVLAGTASLAHADVDALALRFAGGCTTANTNGSCTLRVTATGTELSREGVQLYVAAKQGERFVRVSPRVKPLSENGQASYRVKNTPGGCYQVRTAPNGNDAPDVVSRAVCEK